MNKYTIQKKHFEFFSKKVTSTFPKQSFNNSKKENLARDQRNNFFFANTDKYLTLRKHDVCYSKFFYPTTVRYSCIHQMI